MTVPASMQTDAFKLEGEAEVILYTLVLSDTTTFYLSPKGGYTWLGNTFDEHPCHMTQVARKSDEEVARPKFSFVNPAGVFTAAAHTGLLEAGTITRHRILKSDLLANNDLSLDQVLRITRVVTVNKTMIAVECRGALDGPGFRLPGRAFYPPEFPFVSLR